MIIAVAILTAVLLAGARPLATGAPSVPPGDSREPNASVACDQALSAKDLVAISLSPGNTEDLIQNRAGRVLGVSPTRDAWASVDVLGLESGPLHIQGPSGSHLRVELPGPLGPAAVAALFAVDGTWLVAVDGFGDLWRIDLKNGATSALPMPPEGRRYDRDLAWAPDGRLLAILADGGMETTNESYLVAVELQTGKVEQLSDYPYAAHPVALDEGSFAFVAYVPDGTTAVRVIQGHVEREIANLGEVGHVDISRDGKYIAYDVGNSESFVLAVGGSPKSVSKGIWPRFGPTAELSVLVDGTTRVISSSGQAVCDANSVFAAWAR